MAISRYLRDEMDTAFVEQALEQSNVDETYSEIVDQLLNKEYKHIKQSTESNDDDALETLIRLKINHPNTTRVDRNTTLAALTWRLRQQSVVFEVYMSLCDAGLLDLSTLQHTVDFQSRDKSVRAVYHALNRSFEFGTQTQHPPKVGLCEHYALPEIWLACMIVRGAIAPLQSIASFIAASRTLGTFDERVFRKWWPDGKEFEVNPIAQAVVPSSAGNGFVSIGMHLPMGIEFPCKLEDIYYAFDEPLRVCEEMFVRYFRVPETVFVPAGRIWMP